ncbi:hypothetical protein AWR38_08055 [Idiomarina sp. WRN-38]|uniref:hypothetical protein n=1 Tax=Idiomarina sp. OXR-189 TaxID=3100175 RepID=UPI0007336590|nr:hypothetical protein [Idiomarina sp. OXR-189]KTG23960.1 hypothetical protein AUR68_08040 [Idiomarina sp. H105]OAE91351.1 hypothetical protein AWR38_08055 [Idiomarina sp. WRN-38]WPZ02319.1 hypothetical protein UM402_05305 [Idiomarina sp. OXR-189]
MMKHKIWPLTLAFIGLVTLSTAAFAKEKELTESYIVDSKTEIHVEATVGTVELMPSDNDAVEIELRVESDGDSWFTSGGDIDAVLIKGERKGNKLVVSATPADDMVQHWVIRVPKINHLDLELGVGEISGVLPFINSDIELGVGDLDLDLAAGDYKEVTASVGVGDTRLDNFDNSNNERMMVTSESTYEGTGSVRVDVEVGVGDVRLSKLSN